MPIIATCAECSKRYSLKEELAGKKIRCKACSAVISVPLLKKNIKKSDDEFPLDDGLFDGWEEEDDDEPEYPRRIAKKSLAGKASVVQKRKKKSGTSSNPFGMIAMVGGGLVLFILAFVVASNVVRNALTPMTWKPYDVPGAPGCTVEMPKAPQHKPDPHGTPMIFCEVFGFACGATSESVIPEIQIVFSDLAKNQGIIEKGIAITMPTAKLQSSRTLTMNGFPAAEFTLLINNVTVTKRAFLANGRTITLDFFCTRPRTVEMERFFSSFKAAGFADNPIAQTVNVPALPTNPSPVTPVPSSFAVPSETPANSLVPDEPADSSGPPDRRRTAWRYLDAPMIFPDQTSTAGVFLKKRGENWVEQRKGTSTNYWTETARTTDYVELTRTNGSVLVRLYVDRSTYQLSTESDFKAMFPGRWE